MKNVLQVHDLETGNHLYNFPLDIGSIVGLSGEKKHSELFFKFSSMVTPGIIYHVDMTEANPTPKMFLQTEIEGFNQSDFRVEQVQVGNLLRRIHHHRFVFRSSMKAKMGPKFPCLWPLEVMRSGTERHPVSSMGTEASTFP